jgi:hypothetical protein
MIESTAVKQIRIDEVLNICPQTQSRTWLVAFSMMYDLEVGCDWNTKPVDVKSFAQYFLAFQKGISTSANAHCTNWAAKANKATEEVRAVKWCTKPRARHWRFWFFIIDLQIDCCPPALLGRFSFYYSLSSVWRHRTKSDNEITQHVQRSDSAQVHGRARFQDDLESVEGNLVIRANRLNISSWTAWFSC